MIARIDNEISVQKEDREIYTKDFDQIRKYLLDIMQDTDEIFKQIYSGPSLFGSFLDNIKIVAPNEFDVHFLLKLPFNKQIKAKRDPLRPGYIKLNLLKPLALMKADKNVQNVYELLKNFVNSSGYLLRNKIQNWLKRIIKKALKSHGSSILNDDHTIKYKLIYLKRGTAHTIKAVSNTREISIDFVPAFKFDADNDWFADRPFPEGIIKKLWFAVPKPSVGPKRGRKLTFSICAPQIEAHLLSTKYNLKPSLRLLKSIRDKTYTTGFVIKSYFIKSIYLFESEMQPDNFWMQPPGKILLHMLDKLLHCLENKCIPFYWCPSMNLLESSCDADDALFLLRKLEAVRDSLELYSNQPIVQYKKIRRLFGHSQISVKRENV